RVGGAVAALAQVARAGDEEGPLGLRALDGAAHGLGVLVGAQAHADDVRAVVGAPGDAQGEVALAADALGVEHLHGHDARVDDARRAHAVAHGGRRDARDVRAVARVVHGVVGAGHEVPAVAAIRRA